MKNIEMYNKMICVYCNLPVSINNEFKNIKNDNDSFIICNKLPIGNDAIFALNCDHIYHKVCLNKIQLKNDYKCSAIGCNNEILLGNQDKNNLMLCCYWYYGTYCDIIKKLNDCKRCTKCNKKIINSIHCPLCVIDTYCSKMCQLTDWNSHKPNCIKLSDQMSSSKILDTIKTFRISVILARNNNSAVFDKGGLWTAEIGIRSDNNKPRWELYEILSRSVVIDTLKEYNLKWNYEIDHGPNIVTILVKKDEFLFIETIDLDKELYKNLI